MHIRKPFLYTFGVTLGLLAATGVLAWTAPTASPPGSNALPPLNAGGSPQTKSGGLTVSPGTIGTAGIVSNTIWNHSYCFDNGTNCIQAWPTSAASQWITSGSSIYYNNGNVGIGTSAALPAVFGIQGGSNNSGTTFYINNRTRNDSQLAVLVQAGTASGDFAITTGGNVGIGFTSPGANTKLQVAGRGLFTGGSNDPGDGSPAGVSISYDGTYGNIDAIQTGIAGKPLRLNATSLGTVSTGGPLTVGTTLTVSGALSAASATVGGSAVCTTANGACPSSTWASLSKPYAFDQSTDRGASPTFATLNINGNPALANVSGTNGYTVLYDGSARSDIYLGGTGDATNYYRNTTHLFQSIGAGSTFATLNAAGLNVTGTVTGSQFNGSGAGLTGTAASLNAGSANAVSFNNGLTTASSVTFGNVYASAFYYSSDTRLKKNIEAIASSKALEDILALQPVTYYWIDPARGTGNQIGFIAQQVEGVVPELVTTDATTTLKAVDYARVAPLLVGAIQAQQTEIDELKAEVAALKAGK